MKACIVTGDRHAKWEPWCRVIERTLWNFQEGDALQVIHGGANGIDYLAGTVADSNMDMGYLVVPAQWGKHGNPAGPRRNKAMLDILLILGQHGYDIAVHAFHDQLQYSRGTKNMIDQAINAGVPCFLTTSDGTTEPVEAF